MCHYASNLRRPASDLSTAASCCCDQADTGTAINPPLRQQLRQSTWKCLVKSPRCHRGPRLVGVNFQDC
jgi:hypothetical protein